jgi:aerobactin synthase
LSGSVEERASRRLLAKMISEMAWEELLAPEGDEHFHLRLGSGVTYSFRATRRIWDNFDIDPHSIERSDGAQVCPLQFVVDARAEFGMSPATEAMFLRELSNTLTQDLYIARRYGGLTAAELIGMPPVKLHAALEGHPKAVANKGRLGWGVADHATYAPEAAAPIRAFWIAAARSHVVTGFSAGGEEYSILADTLGGAEARRLLSMAREAGAGTESHLLMPVHPWQWDHYVRQAFCGEIAAGRIVPLGTASPDMLATPSLRTLTPAHGGAYDLKLALGVLNTSAWRGMPGKYIQHGGAISDWLTGLTAADTLLAERVTVLREVMGAWYRHPLMAQSPDAPYRHHELLGAIWRDRAEARVKPGQRPVMAAALFHEGNCGTPLAVAHARAAGVAIQDWLRRLFRVTVVPLWHYLARYGVGFIAHGQNVTVVLQDDLPVGMAIKDFQGDLDLVDQDFEEAAGLPEAVRAILPRKPPAYIVHNIQTAHFVTVLRFLSAALARADALPEQAFYALLREELAAYREAHLELEARFALFELFDPAMPKVCINRVRFQIGYEDSAQRPFPARGTDLVNPLAGQPIQS